MITSYHSRTVSECRLLIRSKRCVLIGGRFSLARQSRPIANGSCPLVPYREVFAGNRNECFGFSCVDTRNRPRTVRDRFANVSCGQGPIALHFFQLCMSRGPTFSNDGFWQTQTECSARRCSSACRQEPSHPPSA